MLERGYVVKDEDLVRRVIMSYKREKIKRKKRMIVGKFILIH